MAQEVCNMKTSMKAALAAAIGMSGLSLGGPAASALPMSGLAASLTRPAEAATTEEVRWVCGPYGNCRFVPGYRYWGGPRRHWGPPRPFAPYGYHRPWGRHYGGGGYYRHW